MVGGFKRNVHLMQSIQKNFHSPTVELTVFTVQSCGRWPTRLHLQLKTIKAPHSWYTVAPWNLKQFYNLQVIKLSGISSQCQKKKDPMNMVLLLTWWSHTCEVQPGSPTPLGLRLIASIIKSPNNWKYDYKWL